MMPCTIGARSAGGAEARHTLASGTAVAPATSDYLRGLVPDLRGYDLAVQRELGVPQGSIKQVAPRETRPSRTRP